MSAADAQEKANPVLERVDLDTILVEEIGQFGWFQLKNVLLAIVVVVFTSFAAAEYIFTASRISTRCLIPECDGDQPEFEPYWLANAVPETSAGSFDNCQRFANVSSSRAVDSATCPATLFNTENLVSCEQYVYQNTDSVVYDYGLACDEWRRTFIGSVQTAGTLVALPITGYISDRWGRRVALTFNAFNTAWLGIVRYWAGTYVGFLVSEFSEAAFGSGGFSCFYILLLEIVGPKYRVIAGAIMNSAFALGRLILSLAAWGVPNWRTLTLVLYVPQVITIVYYWLATESIRWYMSKGRYAESEALLQEVAKVNKKELSHKTLEAFRRTAEEDRRKREEEAEQSINEPWLIVQVFRHKKILLCCIVSPIWWISMTFIYYGMSINSVNMTGNSYLNYAAVSAIEIPAYWVGVFLVDRVGRKPVLIGAFWVCAACQVAYIFMPNDLYALSLTVYLIGTFSIAMVVITIYVYTTELYPTKYRHRLFAFSSMMGRIGSIVAPLTPAMGDALFEEFPFLLFGGFALVSGCLLLLTPETKGIKLPDTMDQADHLGNQKEKAEK